MMNQNISKYKNPEIDKCRNKLLKLELKYNSLVNEKIELEKILFDFQHQHTLELGEIIIKILKLRKEKFFSNKEKYKEAEKDEQEYQKQFNDNESKEIQTLNKNEKIKLKKMFREASILCHPDKVNEKYQKEAQEIFIELRVAYEKNDISKVSKLLENLKTNNYKSNSQIISEIDKLKLLISELEIKIENVVKDIISIKNSDSYKTIVSITDWNEYFNKKKKELVKEYERLIKNK